MDIILNEYSEKTAPVLFFNRKSLRNCKIQSYSNTLLVNNFTKGIIIDREAKEIMHLVASVRLTLNCID